MITTYSYRPETGITKHEGIVDFAEFLGEQDLVFWVDMQSPTDAESYVLTHDFKFHPLSIEDVITEVPTPKIDVYEDYIFLVFKIADYEPAMGLNTKEIDIFLLKNGVVTVHREPVSPLSIIVEKCRRDDRVFSRGPAFLFHAIVDYLADHYNATMEGLEDAVDLVEDEVFDEPDESVMKNIFNLKRDLAAVKRMITPQREILNRLSREHFRLLDPETNIYFRDIFDHLNRVNDLVDSYRDTLTAALEVYFSTVSSKTNEIIKILTIFSAIMLPLTFVVGLYGMNLKMPEFEWNFGYVFVWGIIVLIVGGMLFFFKKQKWF
jgi:magnesium transporter